MNKLKVLLLLVVACLLLSFSANPPQGHSGAPFDSTCSKSGCHSNPGSIGGSVDVAGIPPNVEPGVSYNFRVVLTVTSGSAARGGFQMVSVDDSGNDAGNITNPGSNSTTSTFQGRTYFEHQPAKNFGGADELEYTARWVAPPSGEATFYVRFYASQRKW